MLRLSVATDWTYAGPGYVTGKAATPAVRLWMAALTSACLAFRALPSFWLPSRRKTTNPATGTSRINSNQAIAEEGLRLPGMTPRAMPPRTKPATQRPAASHTGRIVSHPGGLIGSTARLLRARTHAARPGQPASVGHRGTPPPRVTRAAHRSGRRAGPESSATDGTRDPGHAHPENNRLSSRAVRRIARC